MDMAAIHLGLVADRSPTNPHSAREDIEYSLQHADNVHKFNEWVVKVYIFSITSTRDLRIGANWYLASSTGRPLASHL
jgi:hypothetical protein